MTVPCPGLSGITINGGASGNVVEYTGTLAFTVEVNLGNGDDTFTTSATHASRSSSTATTARTRSAAAPATTRWTAATATTPCSAARTRATR